MKKTVIALLVASAVYAENIKLHEIISHVRQNHPNYKAMDEENIALSAKIEAEYARPASSLSLSGANASPDDGDDAFEYSVGASTLIDISSTRDLELSSADLKNQAELLTKQKKLFEFGNNIRNFYHQSCLDKERLTVLQTTLDAFNRLYTKKEKAYKYQEISKKELLQLQLEKKMLEQKLASATTQYDISKESLLNLTAYADTTEQLECRDLYPIAESIVIGNEPFILSDLAFEKEIESLDKLNTRYNKSFEPISVGVAYDDELDTRRIGTGFSIPLLFTSSKNEKSRLFILHQKNMIKFKHHGWLLESIAQKKRLESELKNDYNKIMALSENSDIYENELMPLIEKSFQMGESSVIEYILGRQKLLGIAAELIQAKKSYYHKLFTLYTIVETEK